VNNVLSRLDYATAQREKRVREAIDTFSKIVQNAECGRKHGQFGLVVSMRDGLIGTVSIHKVETIK